MDQIILDEAAIVPLYYDQVIRFVQKRKSNIQNFESNGMNIKRDEQEFGGCFSPKRCGEEIAVNSLVL